VRANSCFDPVAPRSSGGPHRGLAVRLACTHPTHQQFNAAYKTARLFSYHLPKPILSGRTRGFSPRQSIISNYAQLWSRTLVHSPEPGFEPELPNKGRSIVNLLSIHCAPGVQPGPVPTYLYVTRDAGIEPAEDSRCQRKLVQALHFRSSGAVYTILRLGRCQELRSLNFEPVGGPRTRSFVLS
jgi:hypothetical protein